ncbi:MAG: hypothetical protein GXP25_17495, partial [Planctomycetes bacterium]|nr:hypothetical protein [Planctomycetota bacterium]
MLKKLSQLTVIVATCLLFSGCMATTYGGKPVANPTQKNVYTFTLYKNAFATREYMDKKADEQCQKIMAEHGYKDYKILKVDSGILINKDTFHVKFYRT